MNLSKSMRNGETKMKRILMINAFAMILVGCNPITYFYDMYGIADDNLAEEAAEFLIESQTGADIDLTPRSDEE